LIFTETRQKTPSSVIPAKAGIQFYRLFTAMLDPCLRRGDKFFEAIEYRLPRRDQTLQAITATLQFFLLFSLRGFLAATEDGSYPGPSMP
jgi:hypothetical protein